MTIYKNLYLLVLIPALCSFGTQQKNPPRCKLMHQENSMSDITVAITAYTTREAATQAFGISAKRLFFANKKRSIIPVEIRIRNNHKIPITISPDSFHIPQLSAAKVSQYLTSHPLTRVAKTLGIGFGLMALTSYVATNSYFAIGILIVGLCHPLIFVATPIAAIYSASQLPAPCPKTTKSLTRCMLHKPVCLEPGQELDALIFVRNRDLKKLTTITVTDSNNQNFSVAINLQ